MEVHVSLEFALCFCILPVLHERLEHTWILGSTGVLEPTPLHNSTMRMTAVVSGWRRKMGRGMEGGRERETSLLKFLKSVDSAIAK